MPLNPGARLRSQVCTTEVIVVRSPNDEQDLRCGGRPMVEIGAEAAEAGEPLPGFNTGTLLGKRYTTDDPDDTLELLATKGGDGTLSAGEVALVLKEAKPLPSSD